MGLCNRKVVSHCKCGITGNPARNVEDNSLEKNANYGGPSQEVSKRRTLVSGLETILIMY